MKIHFTVSYQELINNSRKLCPFSREKNQTLFSISSTNKMYQFIFYIKLIFYSNKLILILTNLRLIFFPKFPFPKSFCYFIFCIQILSSIFLLPILKQPKISLQDKSTFFFFHLSKKFISILVTFFYQNMHYTFPTYDNVSLIISGSINYKY